MALSDNLISYWSLSEASGNALDAHGSNDLTETGGTIASATGKVGNCRDFEKDDSEWFEHADNADLRTGDIDFSIACWVQFESFDVITVAQKGEEFSFEWRLEFASGSSQFNFYVESTSGAVSTAIGGGASSGTWYFLVCYHDSVNNLVGISVNGGAAVTQSYSSGITTSSGNFWLGRAGGTSYEWDGLIDEFGFWKRVLTGSEITELYNSGSGRDYAYITGGGGGGTKAFPRFLYRQSRLFFRRRF